jgi:hypothetical protein
MAVLAQKGRSARVSDDHHQEKQYAQSDSLSGSEPWWIDPLDRVVRDESVAVSLLAARLVRASMCAARHECTDFW